VPPRQGKIDDSDYTEPISISDSADLSDTSRLDVNLHSLSAQVIVHPIASAAALSGFELNGPIGLSSGLDHATL